MYNETKFNELKELVEANANIMAEMELVNDRYNQLASAIHQDGEYIMTQEEVNKTCKAAKEKADIQEVHVLSAYCKHYYAIVRFICDYINFEFQLKKELEVKTAILKENQNKIQQILAEDIFD